MFLSSLFGLKSKAGADRNDLGSIHVQKALCIVSYKVCDFLNLSSIAQDVHL